MYVKCGTYENYIFLHFMEWRIHVVILLRLGQDLSNICFPSPTGSVVFQLSFYKGKQIKSNTIPECRHEWKREHIYS
jgi:hypothetical protein